MANGTQKLSYWNRFKRSISSPFTTQKKQPKVMTNNLLKTRINKLPNSITSPNQPITSPLINLRTTMPNSSGSTNFTKSKNISTDPITFQFTRHGPSCNNLNEGLGSTITQVISIGTKKFGKDAEPGLVWLGIIELILFMTNLKLNSVESDYKPDRTFHPYQYHNMPFIQTYESNTCVVSNLYRTWITAILMHGSRKQNKDTLNLLVCPYLKEKHGTFKNGNYPIHLQYTFYKLLKFLNNLHEVFHYDEKPSEYGTKLYKTLQELNIDKNPEEDQQKFYKKWYKNLPNTIRFYLLPENISTTQKNQTITITKDITSLYTINNDAEFCDISSNTLGATISKVPLYYVSSKGYTETGSLQTFMKWFTDNRQTIISKYPDLSEKDLLPNNLLSVITHSNLMRTYVSNTWKLDKEKIYYREQNAWSFQTMVQTKDTIIPSFVGSSGVLVEDGCKQQKKSNILENLMRKYSLCGTDGHATNLCKNNNSSKNYNTITITGKPNKSDTNSEDNESTSNKSKGITWSNGKFNGKFNPANLDYEPNTSNDILTNILTNIAPKSALKSALKSAPIKNKIQTQINQNRALAQRLQSEENKKASNLIKYAKNHEIQLGGHIKTKKYKCNTIYKNKQGKYNTRKGY